MGLHTKLKDFQITIYRLQNDWPNSKITQNTDQVVPNGISQENGVTIVNIHNEDNSFIDEFDKIDMNSTVDVEDTYCYTYRYVKSDN